MVANRVEKLCEIGSLTDVRDRYSTPGPHATVVATIPTPASVDLDRGAVINATCTQLRHGGADADVIARLREAMEAVEPRGEPVLITANSQDVVLHRLSWEHHRGRLDTSVGPLPALLPVVAELRSRGPVVGALVDRVGADLFLLTGQRVEPIGTVEGDVDAVTRGGPGASSARRFTHRAEAGVDMNADLAARALADAVTSAGARAVVLSGDERAMVRVVHHLGQRTGVPAATRPAGGRHEPASAGRLLDESEALLTEHYTELCRETVDRVTEELGQHDRAVNGLDDVRRSVDEGRASLVVFAHHEGPFGADLEELAGRALDRGSDLLVLDSATAADHLDTVAALLRY